MKAFHVTWHDTGAVEFFHGTSQAQANLAAIKTRPGITFDSRPATDEEHAALLAAHSAVLDAGDE